MNIKVPKFLIRIVDKIFNRKKKVIPISIKIPTREELINNNENEKIALLDKYKKDYIEKLGSKLLFSIISSEKLINNYKMNQEITLKHLKDNKYNNVSDIIGNGNVKELLEVKLEFFKLFILTEQNTSLYNEIILRIAALNEISEEELIILPRKKRAILNEYDTLYTGLIVTTSSRYASIQDTEIYLIRMNEINKYIKNITNGEQKLLNERKELVIKIANIFIKDKLDSVLNSNVNDIGLIAYLEIELEKYLYEHKEEFTLLDTELNNIKRGELNKDNKEKLLKQIEELELKYLCFYKYNKYNKNFITKEMFKELYEIKFNILTYDIDCFNESPIKKDDRGYRFYKLIITKKVSNIINGNNIHFNNNFVSNLDIDKKNFAEVRNLFKKEFLDINRVMFDIYRLKTLLSFDREDGFINMLYNYKVNKNDIEKIKMFWPNDMIEKYKYYFLNENGPITFQDNLHLTSILEILRIICNKKMIYGSSNSYIYGLYTKKMNKEYSNSYKLPNEIKKIDFETLSKGAINRCNSFYCQSIILPISLNNIIGVPKNSCIVFQEGLEEIDYTLFSNIVRKGNVSVKIPSSVRRFSGIPEPFVFEGIHKEILSCIVKGREKGERWLYNHWKYYEYKFTNQSKIIFEDFKNSMFLKDRKHILYLLRIFCYYSNYNDLNSSERHILWDFWWPKTTRRVINEDPVFGPSYEETTYNKCAILKGYIIYLEQNGITVQDYLGEGFIRTILPWENPDVELWEEVENIERHINRAAEYDNEKARKRTV